MTQTRRWVAITSVAALVILAAGWFLLVKPQNSKKSSLHAQTTAQQQANQVLMTQNAALQAEQKQLPQQQLILQKFSTEVPDNAAEPTLLRQLSSAANGAGVDLSAITPGAPAVLGASTATGGQTLGASSGPAPSLYELPLTMAVSGSYANLESFFNGIERLPRAMLVTAFSLAPGTSGTAPAAANELTASLTAGVFFAPGSAPPPVPTPAPAAPAPASQTGTAPASQTGTAPASQTGTAPNPNPVGTRPPIQPALQGQ
jgi:Tfp pilus assembly protein PilO